MGANTSELTWAGEKVWTATEGVPGGDLQDFPDALAALWHLSLGAPLSRETLWYLQMHDSDIFWSEIRDEAVLCLQLRVLVLHDCSTAVAGEVFAALANGSFRQLRILVLSFETDDFYGISTAETNAVLDMFSSWGALIEWTSFDDDEPVCAKIRFDRMPRKKRGHSA
jgi:hypothetical protein